MRAFHAAILVVFALLAGIVLVACESGEGRRDRIARVSQATTDDGRADSLYGQPDFTASSAQSAISGLSSPHGLAINPQPGGATQIRIADTEYNRTLGVTLPLGTIVELFGQISIDGTSPNAGSTVSSFGVDHPNDVNVFGGQVLIADTNNHRVLFVSAGSRFASQAFGQGGSLNSGVRNLGGVSQTSLAEPKAASFVFDPSFGTAIAIADAGNHRVLLYTFGELAAHSVIGQADFTSFLPNQGASIDAVGLRDPHDVERATPYDLSVGIFDPRHSGFLVADTGNHRVLRFVCASGFGACGSAVEVWGQPDFLTGDPGVGADRLNAPSAIALDPNRGFWVADTGNNRVVHFDFGKKQADRVLGQPDLDHGDPPAVVSASTLSAPEGVAVASNGDVYVADTGANRVVGFTFVPSPDTCDDGDPCTDDSIGASGCQHFLTSESNACRPYACDVGNHVCFKDCAHAACDPPWLCTGTTCALPCDSPSACASGFCVDGWCCDAECGGTCEACNVPGREGKCSPVTGLPQLRSPKKTCFSPNGSLECAGQCDGATRDACVPRTKGIACGVRSCANGRENLGGKCDGAGSCIPESRDCFPYACGAATCRTECEADDECAANARCIDRVCIDEARAITSVGGSCATSFGDGDLAPYAVVVALALAARRRRRTS